MQYFTFLKGGAPMTLTSAMEDYLEAVLMLQKQKGYARCVDVAERLGVKKPSVSRAVEKLSKSGHIMKTANGTLSLDVYKRQSLYCASSSIMVR